MPPNRLSFRLGQIAFHLALLVAVGLAGWLAARHPMAWDWSLRGANSLSETSRDLLGRLQGPLQVTCFAPEDPQLRGQVTDIIERYRRLRPDIGLEFVNPDTQPDLVRRLGVRLNGELRLEYQGRSEHLRVISEQSMSNAIQRLLLGGERWVAALTGHGERRMDGVANHDLGEFAQELERKGLRVQPLDLGEATTVPDNAAFLVIASPQIDLLGPEIERIRDYLDHGGNLLWLAEPDGLKGLEPIAERLGIGFLAGTVLDSAATRLGLESPAIAVVARYPDQPAVAGFELKTLFPFAAALEQVDLGEWEGQPILTTLSGSWNELGPLSGEVAYEPARGERAGPLHLGLTLTRPRDQGQQRVIVIGDGDFLSNRYLGNAGNLDLGLNLVRWLAGDDHLLAIPVRLAPDRELQLDPAIGVAQGAFFLLGLPTALLLTGVLIRRRRRQRA